MKCGLILFGALVIAAPTYALARESRGAIIVACELNHVVALKAGATIRDQNLTASERKHIAFRIPIVAAADMTATDFDVLDPQQLLAGKTVKDWQLPSATEPKLSWVAAVGDDKANLAVFALTKIIPGENGFRTGQGSVTLVAKSGADVSTATYLGDCTMTGTQTDGSDFMAALKKKYGEGAGGNSK